MDICPICLDIIELNNSATTKCGHTFHLNCILKNIKLNTHNGFKCAICRKNFLLDNNIINNNTNINIVNSRIIGNNPSPTIMSRHLQNSQNIANERRRRNIRNNWFWDWHANSIRSSRVEAIEREKQQIKKLSFRELKLKLQENVLSTRGYIRENLEKKLFQKLNL